MNEYDYKIRVDLFCMIENMFSLGCFTLLAIVSNHWWVVFFALLFQYMVDGLSKIVKEVKDEEETT